MNLSVTDATGSDFVASGDEGDKTVTIASGNTTATYNVTTQSDTTDEPNGSVTVTVKTGSGYTVGAANSANVTVNDDDGPANNAPVFTSQPDDGVGSGEQRRRHSGGDDHGHGRRRR